MLSRLYLALVLFSLGFSGVAASEADEVLASLQGYEWQLDEEKLASLPAGSWEIMLNSAQDEGQSGFIRARAAASLTAFPNDVVWQFFIQGTQNPDSVVARRRSVDGLCAAFGTTRVPALEAVLVPLLEDTDTHLRVQTATCLQLIDTDTARAALATYRDGISQDWEARAVGIDSRQTH